MQRGLALTGVDWSEELIGKEGAQFIAQTHVHIASGKRGMGNAGGLSGNRLQGITRQAHLSSLLNEMPLPSPTMLLSCQFANSIQFGISDRAKPLVIPDVYQERQRKNSLLPCWFAAASCTVSLTAQKLQW
jgi:hypothetical protein